MVPRFRRFLQKLSERRKNPKPKEAVFHRFTGKGLLRKEENAGILLKE